MADAHANTTDDGPPILPAGDHALLVRLSASEISPRVNGRTLALLAALDAAALPGVRDYTPAYASLLISFDPHVTTRQAVTDAVHTAWRATRERRRRPATRGVVHVQVRYGGAAGFDLDEVARLTGLSAAEVVRRHASAEYRVYFLGFLAGYPYLGGLPASLATPRLDSPRTRVPAGSVAIAERQTGVYPVESPGGWRVIGRTTMRVFDPRRFPPAAFAPGDRVRFVPVEGDDDDDPGAEPAGAGDDVRHTAPPTPGAIPCLRVERAGPLTTVQDLGRWGYARYGVTPGGAADPDAARRGNLLVGNPPDAAALEITLGGARFTILQPCLLALTGASCPATLDGRTLAPGILVWAAAGSELALGQATAGLRVYLCVARGVAVPCVLGSRATDLRAGFGGYDGRALREGDVLWRQDSDSMSNPGEGAPRTVAGRGAMPAAGGCWTLRVTRGPESALTPAGVAALLDHEFVVSSRSDRMGIRLAVEHGVAIPDGGQILSAGTPRGAIQLPPSGEPVILGADGQTTGGYRVPLVVASADWWRIGQARPGDHVRLRLLDDDEAAEVARRERRLSGGASSAQSLDPALLMRGFMEWSDG
jgi:KipI family sensor histidine kinase inhibitor